MGKKRIAVFDFCAADCAVTAAAVRQYYREQKIPAAVREFTAKELFVRDFGRKWWRGEFYEMVFIGVDNLPGLEIFRSIREFDLWQPILMVSKSKDYAFHGFQLRAANYLLKPVAVERLAEVIRNMSRPCTPWLLRPRERRWNVFS